MVRARANRARRHGVFVTVAGTVAHQFALQRIEAGLEITRVFMQVARELNVPIHVERAKMRLMECMQLSEEDSKHLHTLSLAENSSPQRWRVVPMGHLRAPKLRALLASNRAHFDAIVAFRPSGWCFNGASGGAAGRAVRLGSNVTIHEVPYSEHSSFDELVDEMVVKDLEAVGDI